MLTTLDNQPISFGYNGFPVRVLETDERWDSSCKYDYVIHAEVNAILNAAKTGAIGLKNSRLYVTLFPCSKCALQVIQAGVREIIFDAKATRDRLNDRPEFRDDHDLAASLLEEAQVGYYGI